MPYKACTASPLGQQATPRPISAMPAMRLIITPAPLISAENSTLVAIGGYASTIMPVAASAKLAITSTFIDLHQQRQVRSQAHAPTSSHRESLLLSLFGHADRRTHWRCSPPSAQAGRQSFRSTPPMLLANLLKLLLLIRIE